MWGMNYDTDVQVFLCNIGRAGFIGHLGSHVTLQSLQSIFSYFTMAADVDLCPLSHPWFTIVWWKEGSHVHLFTPSTKPLRVAYYGCSMLRLDRLFRREIFVDGSQWSIWLFLVLCLSRDCAEVVEQGHDRLVSRYWRSRNVYAEYETLWPLWKIVTATDQFKLPYFHLDVGKARLSVSRPTECLSALCVSVCAQN